MLSSLFIWCLLLTIKASHADTSNEKEEDFSNLGEMFEAESDSVYQLNQLYVYDSSDFIDPFDMTSSKEEQERKSNILDNKKLDILKSKASSVHSSTLTVDDECKVALEHSNSLLEREKKLARILQNELKENGLSQKAFYDRILKRFWNLFNMAQLLEDDYDGEPKSCLMSVQMAKEDALAFKDYFEKEKNLHPVDDFFYKNLYLKECSNSGCYAQFKRFFSNFISSENLDIEHAIYFLGMVFISLSLWAFILFLFDIYKNFKWKKAMIMLAILFFFISYLWHWRHMLKVRQSKRHSQLMKQNNHEIPNECLSEDSLWSSFTQIFTRRVSPCEKHYESLMVDPSDEISPLLVASETIALFLLHPLEALGTQIGKFFSNFFMNIPFLYQIPAVIVFLCLVLLLIFAFFNYGIEFPFWMGGIKPFHKEKSTLDRKELEKIINESIESQNEDRTLFMKEAKNMLFAISRAAIAMSEHQSTQGILSNSAHIIEKQLENLVQQKFNHSINSVVEKLENGTSLHLETHQRSFGHSDKHDGQESIHPRLRKGSSMGSLIPTSNGKASSSNKSLEKAVVPVSSANNYENHNLNNSNESNFMLRVKDILEKSVSDDESFFSNDEGNVSHNEEFLQKVKKVLTP